MAETFTKWISLDGVFDSASSWSNGVPDINKIALFERGSGVKPSINADLAGAAWKGLIVEPGFEHDIAQSGAPLHIRVRSLIQHRGRGKLHLKLTKYVNVESQVVLDGDATIEGVDAASDFHVLSILVLSGDVQLTGKLKVWRTLEVRRRSAFQIGRPRVTIRSTGSNGSINAAMLSDGHVIFEEPFEFQAGAVITVDGALAEVRHANAANFWIVSIESGQLNFHPVKDALLGQVSLHGGVFDTRFGTALKDVQRLVRTGGILRLDARTDIQDTVDLTRQ